MAIAKWVGLSLVLALGLVACAKKSTIPESENANTMTNEGTPTTNAPTDPDEMTDPSTVPESPLEPAPVDPSK